MFGGGLLCVVYGVLIERRWFRRRDYRLPVLPDTAAGPLTVLHLSDLHFVRDDPGKGRFLSSLPQPDVAVITGDLLGEPEAVERVIEALRPIRGRVASYVVFGSNDYFAPRPLNYSNYFRRERRIRRPRPNRPGDLLHLLEGDGWELLKNRRTGLDTHGVRFEVLVSGTSICLWGRILRYRRT